jgi:hypothetical protein
LGQFIDDLKSGKLHREFHFGPDEEEDKVEDKSEEESCGENEIDGNDVVSIF